MHDLNDFIQAQLRALSMLPELYHLLEELVTADIERLGRNKVLHIVPTMARLFNNTDNSVVPFAAAWLTMYAAITRLDDLHDGDLLLPPFPSVAPVSEQYNVVFGYYLLAQHFLDELDPNIISIARITRVRRFWSNAILRMAAGQYRDLIAPTSHAALVLDHYQALAQAKTGATFALAFGGTAMLLCDDPSIYESLVVIGEIFGVLLQFGDDLNDAATQPNTTLTLPDALKQVQLDGDLESIFPVIYGFYYNAVVEQLRLLPSAIQDGVRILFAQTFTQSSGAVE